MTGVSANTNNDILAPAVLTDDQLNASSGFAKSLDSVSTALSVKTPSGDGGFQSVDIGVAGAQQIASNNQNDVNWLKPDAAIYGASANVFNGVGGFILSPTGNPLDWTTDDGTPSNVVFGSANVTLNKASWGGIASGGVATYNPDSGIFEPGYGGSAKVVLPGGVPVIVFANARVPSDVDLSTFTGTLAGNFGVAISADQTLALGLEGLAKASAVATAAAPNPVTPKVAAGSAAGSSVLRAIGQVGNGYVGGGYRVEFKFENGALEGVYYKGQKIHDPQQAAEDIINGAPRYKPPVIANAGIPEIANLNNVNQMIFGTSPWDLAQSSGGMNHGNGAVSLANNINTIADKYGVRDIETTGLNLEIDSMSEAKAVIETALSKSEGNSSAINDIVTLAANPYNIDFGIPVVRFQNGLDEGLRLFRPDDYQFVRDVFEGDYRHNTDLPRQ